MASDGYQERDRRAVASVRDEAVACLSKVRDRGFEVEREGYVDYRISNVEVLFDRVRSALAGDAVIGPCRSS